MSAIENAGKSLFYRSSANVKVHSVEMLASPRCSGFIELSKLFRFGIYALNEVFVSALVPFVPLHVYPDLGGGGWGVEFG